MRPPAPCRARKARETSSSSSNDGQTIHRQYCCIPGCVVAPALPSLISPSLPGRARRAADGMSNQTTHTHANAAHTHIHTRTHTHTHKRDPNRQRIDIRTGVSSERTAGRVRTSDHSAYSLPSASALTFPLSQKLIADSCVSSSSGAPAAGVNSAPSASGAAAGSTSCDSDSDARMPDGPDSAGADDDDPAAAAGGASFFDLDLELPMATAVGGREGAAGEGETCEVRAWVARGC